MKQRQLARSRVSMEQLSRMVERGDPSADALESEHDLEFMRYRMS
jgi:hypothetical protein